MKFDFTVKILVVVDDGNIKDLEKKSILFYYVLKRRRKHPLFEYLVFSYLKNCKKLKKI